MTPGLKGYWEHLQLDVFSCSQLQSPSGHWGNLRKLDLLLKSIFMNNHLLHLLSHSNEAGKPSFRSCFLSLLGQKAMGLLVWFWVPCNSFSCLLTVFNCTLTWAIFCAWAWWDQAPGATVLKILFKNVYVWASLLEYESHWEAAT